MACSGCGKRYKKLNDEEQYKYSSDGQLNVRLEAYKKKYCKGCCKREKCDYDMYEKCQKSV